MRRIVFVLILAGLISAGGLALRQQHVAAASCIPSVPQGCGYFNDRPENAWDNVLPAPALINVGNSGSAAQRTQNFINTMRGYVFSGDDHTRIGASFIVDDMLQYRGAVNVPAGGGSGAGVSYAQSHFNQWASLVNYYGNSPQPGRYGIDFNYRPSLSAFCDSGNNIDSGYDPVAEDPVLYHVPPSGVWCNNEYNWSMPEIRVYWPGGSFNIGKQCGNVQQSAQRIPVPNSPHGSISLSCTNATIGQQTARVTLGDNDGGTDGYITVNGWTSGKVGSPGPANIILPAPPTTNPFSAQTVTLWVKDVGIVGTGGYDAVASANTQVPCAIVSCSISSPTPNLLDPNMTFSVAVTVTSSVGLVPGAQAQLTITPPAGATYSYTSPIQPTSSGAATFSGLGPTNKPGVYNLLGRAIAPGINKTCTSSVSVFYLPYLNVYGGDVLTGSSSSYNAGVSSCTTDSSAGVFSWNNYNTGYSGAGAQYAVQTLAAIVEFASGLSSNNTPPAGLSFANVDPAYNSPGQGKFGGYFGAPGGDCNFTGDLTSAPVSGAAATSAIAALPAQLPDASQTVVYANGDVYISRDIIYTTSGWTNVSQIPFFKLVVVGGDIYIDRTVSKLDGLYVAEPNGATGGRIYTCATGPGVAVNPTLPGSYTTCNKQLVVNGAFVARYVAFGRTYGSVGQAKTTDSLSSNHDAEVFNYTPELWLPRGASSPGDAYTSITGLPPVL